LFWGNECAFILFYFKIILLKGKGVEVNVFFSPLDIGRRKGRGFFFIVEWVGRGSRFFFFSYVERGWEGEGVGFFFAISLWVGWGRVGLINLILAKIN
jgi:hypothetical protein